MFLAVTAVCSFFFIHEVFKAKEEISGYSYIRKGYTSVIYPCIDEDTEGYYPKETDLLPYIEADFGALLQVNPETVGWLAVPGTVISYPVVQTDNNSKYLDIDFSGKYSNTGTPFVDADNDLQVLDMNTIIYGHNMGIGRTDMFGSLTDYKDYDFYSSHRYIQFDAIYRLHGWWKVFAIIEYDTQNDSFLYQQIQFQSTDDFMNWIEEARALSIHKSDITIAPDNHILTLSTCDKEKYGRNGRLLVVAVKLNTI